MVVHHLTCGFVLCTPVHVQAVSGLELLPALLTRDNFPHMGFYVVSHVLSDLTKLATDKALQLSALCLPGQALNLLIQSGCVTLGILYLTYKVHRSLQSIPA